MDVLQSAQDLVDKVLIVLVCQCLPGGHNSLQVTLVQLGDDV